MKIIKFSQNDFDAQIEKLVFVDSVSKPEVVNTVSEIIKNIHHKGDAALLDYTSKFDGFAATKENIKISESEIEKAYANCDKKLIEALQEAFNRVKAYHEKQKFPDEKYDDGKGFTLGWKWTAVESVGLYVPGGKAFYPSSVIMNAVPAIVAGVKRIVITVPAPKGELNPVVLAAAKVCGIKEIYKVGGAQAVAALAYGTETIKPVVKIVGPGNAYVAEAKRQVFGKVGIDMVAGPSEILVIADKNNNPRWLAADLLSQAEHDADARSFMITDDEEFAKKVIDEVNKILDTLDRKDIAAPSIKNNGTMIIVKNINDAIAIADKIAAEHLEICTENADEIAKKITNAGAIFIGAYTPEPIGDYIAGPSHVLPTMATAKFSSGLGVFDFIKRTSLIKASEQAIRGVAEKTIRLAEEEKLGAHALAVKVRVE